MRNFIYLPSGEAEKVSFCIKGKLYVPFSLLSRAFSLLRLLQELKDVKHFIIHKPRGIRNSVPEKNFTTLHPPVTLTVRPAPSNPVKNPRLFRKGIRQERVKSVL